MKYVSLLCQHASQRSQGSRAEEFPCGVSWCLASRGEGRQVWGQVWGQGGWQGAPHPCQPHGQGAERSVLTVALTAPPSPSPLLLLLKYTQEHSQPQHLGHSSAHCTTLHSLHSWMSHGWRTDRVGEEEMALKGMRKERVTSFMVGGRLENNKRSTCTENQG